MSNLDAIARVVLLCVFVGLSACSDTRGTFQEADVPTWSLVEELRIGSLDDGDQALTHISSEGVAVGPSKQIFVAQQQAGEIRKYDSAGAFVRTFGRRGSGPGEFDRNSFSIGTLGDTLYAITPSSGRLHLFLFSGRHLTTSSLVFSPQTQHRRPHRPIVLLPDGHVAVSTHDDDSIEYLRSDRSGRLLNTLFSHTEPMGLSIPYGDGVFRMTHLLPDYPIVTFAHDGSRMAIVERKAATSDVAEFRITELTLAGDTVHSTEVAYRTVPIPPEVIDRIHRQIAMPGTRVFGPGGERTILKALQLTDYSPPVRELLYADDHSLWIMREERSGPNDLWEVYLDGRPVGRLQAPRGLVVHVIRRNALWGVETDELGVPYIVRYRLERDVN